MVPWPVPSIASSMTSHLFCTPPYSIPEPYITRPSISLISTTFDRLPIAPSEKMTPQHPQTLFLLSRARHPPCALNICTPSSSPPFDPTRILTTLFLILSLCFGFIRRHTAIDTIVTLRSTVCPSSDYLLRLRAHMKNTPSIFPLQSKTFVLSKVNNLIRLSSDGLSNTPNTSPGNFTLRKISIMAHTCNDPISLAPTNLCHTSPLLTTNLIPLLLLLHSMKHYLDLHFQDNHQSKPTSLMLPTSVRYAPNSTTLIFPNQELLPLLSMQILSDYHLLTIAWITMILFICRQHLPSLHILTLHLTTNQDYDLNSPRAAAKYATNYSSMLQSSCSHLSALCPEHAHADFSSPLGWRLPAPHHAFQALFQADIPTDFLSRRLIP